MQEFKCSQCGYTRWQKEAIDMMFEMPMFGSFGGPNILSVMNYVEDTICPNCGSAVSWNPIINNDNF